MIEPDLIRVPIPRAGCCADHFVWLTLEEARKYIHPDDPSHPDHADFAGFSKEL